MRKSVLVCFNSSQVGGAERSMIAQSKNLSLKHELHFLVPITSMNSCLDEWKKELNQNFISFVYPASLFSISRHKLTVIKLLKGIIWGLPKVLWNISFLDFRKFDVLWLNGNKIASILVLWAFVTGYKGRVVWHHRDYPSRLVCFFHFLASIRGISINHLCNSYSVKDSLQKLSTRSFGSTNVIYNPVGFSPVLKISAHAVRRIGIVSMMAPWKGVHQAILWAVLYEESLRSLGIDEVAIFGGQIYDTEGPHKNYLNQIQTLSSKATKGFIQFKGLENPETLFSQIDMLIHSSIEPEPFGRVILEAFRSRVPVISTGLGGAKELLGNQERGLIYQAADYHDLMMQVKAMIQNKEQTKFLIDRAHEFSKNLEKEISSKLSFYIDDLFEDSNEEEEIGKHSSSF